MNSSSTVSAELELRLVVPGQPSVALAASLQYSREDPYAVRMAFYGGLEEPIEWTFARDLLTMGVAGYSGIGDVRVWPSAGRDGGAPGSVLNIELASPFGQAHFEVPAAEILAFLHRTNEIVPADEEGDHVDIEAELNDLLRQAS